jgi:hypothetical protein
MKRLALVAVTVFAAACSSGTPESAPPASTGPAASTPPAAAASSVPRVFFVSPKDGETVKSPVHLMFGIENYQLAAVPEGTPTTARPGMGHHHIGVDTDCLAPGTVIPKASPWVHFGTGATMMDPGVQLTPGTHKLALQTGDDLHTAIPGLCSTITITVTP